MTDLDTAQAPPMATGIPTPSDDYATKVFGHISALRPRRRHHKQNVMAATLIIEEGELYAAACVRRANLASAAQLRKVVEQRDEAEREVERLQQELAASAPFPAAPAGSAATSAGATAANPAPENGTSRA